MVSTSQYPGLTVQRQLPTMFGIRGLSRLAFDCVPEWMRRRVFGVQYIQLEDRVGGKLWVTQHGWKHLEAIQPVKWYAGKRYSRFGQRLSGGTSAVYRYETSYPHVALVVKFSRVAQHVPLAGLGEDEMDSATMPETTYFNDPFQEISLVEALRNSRTGSGDRILTKRPLAIYSPANRYESRQLGRSEDAFRRHQARMAAEQRTLCQPLGADDFTVQRQYILLYHWVRGVDVQTLVQRGRLSSGQAVELTHTVEDELSSAGFRVIDMKPNHIIVREDHDGSLLQRERRTAYALVDFELLRRFGTENNSSQQTLVVDHRSQSPLMASTAIETMGSA